MRESSPLTILAEALLVPLLVTACGGGASSEAATSGPSTFDSGASFDGASIPSDSPMGPSPVEAGDAAPPLPVKSLRSDFGAKCDGVTNDRDAVAAAFAAAAGNAFRLQVDAACAAYVKVGMDITKPIFIESGTAVEVLAGGKFILDNESIPTFEIADTENVTLTNWHIQYVGSLPVSNTSWQGGNYNDKTLKTYLATRRGIKFDASSGWVSARWASPTNMCAIFDIRGETSSVVVTGMTLTGGATGDRFIPMAFSITAEAKPGQTVSTITPVTSAVFALPTHLTFSDVTIDGAYFGWQGQPTNSTFTNIKSLRYGDLQDAQGGSVGGANCPATGACELAPPHLFYFNESGLADAALSPHDNEITNVMDMGIRVGVARNPGSGNACSLKFGGANSTVDGYVSYRPDGLMDVLASTGNTIKNVTATYDSTFCSDKWPGIRFPAAAYVDLTMQNIDLRDTAANTDHGILSNANYLTNANISGLTLTMNHWAGTGDFVAAFGGAAVDNASANYDVVNDLEVKAAGRRNGVTFELGAKPSKISAGGSTTLTWSSAGASSCVASGAWSGALGPSGSQPVLLATAGAKILTLSCSNGSDTGVATVTVTVGP